MKKLEEIKERIQTTNPTITDELLELLYEYVSVRYCDELVKYQSEVLSRYFS